MDPPRDRLRQLLDAVLAEPHDDLTSMAAGANFSPFHFSRMLRRGNLSEEELFRVRAPEHVILPWDGEENHLAAVLDNLVWTHETWLASLEGHDTPTRGTVSVSNLASRHADVAPRWLAFWREIERRGAWNDTLIDALCDPPESFQMASVLAHVITFSAHRRQIARTWLRQCGLDPGTGDRILWHRDQKDHT